MLVSLIKDTIMPMDVIAILQSIRKFGADGLVISSKGGISSSMALLNYSAMQSKGFCSIGIGIVSSLAVNIFVCCDKRFATKEATFFFHRPYIFLDGIGEINAESAFELAVATRSDDLKEVAHELSSAENHCVHLMSRKTGIMPTTARQMLFEKITITAREALSMGVIQEIVPDDYVEELIIPGAGIINPW